MRELVFSIVCVLMTMQVYAQESPDTIKTTEMSSHELTIQSDKTDSLIRHTRLTAQNTEPTPLGRTDKDDWIILVASIFAVIIAIPTLIFDWNTAIRTKKTAEEAKKTAEEAKKTAQNVDAQTKQHEINKQAQEAIFIDLIRHLYRNKVCVCAIHWKLEENGFDKFYPSEEHLLKLKVLPEDLRLDRFDSTPEHYGILHEMELRFRNYNIEVDVALEHLKTRLLPREDKIRDLVFTLEFKSQQLTKLIQTLMNDIAIPITDEMITKTLIDVSKRYADDNIEPYKPHEVPEREKMDRGNDRYRYYDDILKIGNELNSAISNEYNKINIIKFLS